MQLSKGDKLRLTLNFIGKCICKIGFILFIILVFIFSLFKFLIKGV